MIEFPLVARHLNWAVNVKMKCVICGKDYLNARPGWADNLSESSCVTIIINWCVASDQSVGCEGATQIFSSAPYFQIRGMYSGLVCALIINHITFIKALKYMSVHWAIFELFWFTSVSKRVPVHNLSYGGIELLLQDNGLSTNMKSYESRLALKQRY